MGFAERSFPAVVLVMAIVISLCGGLSCAATSPATAPAVTPVPQANRQPVIQSIAGSSDWLPLTEGRFTCIASDPDDDRLSYYWTADNGTISGNGATATWISPAAEGKYNITITVNDGKGGEANKVQEVRVNLNPDAPLVLKMSLPSRETVMGAKRVRSWLNSSIECVVEGTDARDLKYSWTSANGTLRAGAGLSLEGGTASKVNWMAPGAGGDYTVNVTVTDSRGNEARGQVKFKVVCCTE